MWCGVLFRSVPFAPAVGYSNPGPNIKEYWEKEKPTARNKYYKEHACPGSCTKSAGRKGVRTGSGNLSYKLDGNEEAEGANLLREMGNSASRARVRRIKVSQGARRSSWAARSESWSGTGRGVGVEWGFASGSVCMYGRWQV